MFADINYFSFKEIIMNSSIKNSDTQAENVLFGIVGAFLFSLVGGVLYYLLYQMGYLAALSGLVGVICAIKGYSFFAKKESTKGTVISVIIAALVLVAAWYLCVASDLHAAYNEWYAQGEVDSIPSFFDCVRVVPDILKDFPEYFKDLAISLILAAVGCGSYIANTIKNRRLKAEASTNNAAPTSDSEPASAEQEEKSDEDAEEASDENTEVKN